MDLRNAGWHPEWTRNKPRSDPTIAAHRTTDCCSYTEVNEIKSQGTMIGEGVPGQGLTVVYDGDCPLCSAYVTQLRLKETAGSLRLEDARQHPETVEALSEQGYSLDEGMVVIAGARVYHGADAIHVLALMSSRRGWLNRLNYRVFRSRNLSAALYPALVAGRRALLWLLGRARLSAE